MSPLCLSLVPSKLSCAALTLPLVGATGTTPSEVEDFHLSACRSFRFFTAASLARSHGPHPPALRPLLRKSSAAPAEALGASGGRAEPGAGEGLLGRSVHGVDALDQAGQHRFYPSAQSSVQLKT